MLDMPAFMGVEQFEKNVVFTRKDIEGCVKTQALTVRAGDAILVRTGYLARWDGRGENPEGGQGGLGLDVAGYLIENNVALIGADNVVEALWAEDEAKGEWLELRVELIRNRGMNVLENAYLEELARDRVYEFLLTVAPLNISGATHSPINPIAIA